MLLAALAAVVVPFVLLSGYGYAKEMHWGRLLGMMGAALLGLGAGIGLVYSAGLIKGLVAKAGFGGLGSIGTGFAGLSTAVTATVVTAAVLVSVTTLAPKESSYNIAAQELNLNQPDLNPTPLLAQKLDSVQVPADSPLRWRDKMDTPENPNLLEGTTGPLAEAGTQEIKAKDEAAKPGYYSQPGDQQPTPVGEDAMANAERAETDDEPAAVGTLSSGADAEDGRRRDRDATEKKAKASEAAAPTVAMSSLSLRAYSLPAVLVFPATESFQVQRLNRLDVAQQPSETGITLGLGQPYLVLVGGQEAVGLKLPMIVEEIKRDRAVKATSLTQQGSWQVLRVLRREDSGSYTISYQLFQLKGDMPSKAFQVYSPKLYASERAAKNAAEFEVR